MVRSFEDRAVDPTVVDRICDLARRAPSAGNAQGTALLVLDDPRATARYWQASLPAERRAGFGWPGLLRAPVLVVVLVSPEPYLARYAEPDKASTGLGRSADGWPVPYWHVDGGMAVMALLLGAVDAGLGACFFGLFAHERPVLDAFDVPPAWQALGTVALGHPDGSDPPGRSTARPRRSLDEVVHRGRW
jgi:nitroreductase